MTDAGELRTLIRDLLREELARLTPPGGAAAARIEPVTLGSDRDLMTFVHHLLKLADVPRSRREIESGHLRFTLAGTTAAAAPARSPAAAPAFTRGLVSEQQIEALDHAVSRIEVAKSVRFTPLALDRLRQRGITIQRTSS